MNDINVQLLNNFMKDNQVLLIFHSKGLRPRSGPIVVFIQGLTLSWGFGGSERSCLLAFLRL